jgi:hypothetical protein
MLLSNSRLLTSAKLIPCVKSRSMRSLSRSWSRNRRSTTCKFPPNVNPRSIQRKAVKKFTRQTQRETKVLYNKTRTHDVAYKVANDIKKQLSDHRERTDKIVKSLETRHRIQIKQFVAAGDRRVSDTRALLVIQCKGISEEQTSSATKECNSKIGHFQVRPSP